MVPPAAPPDRRPAPPPGSAPRLSALPSPAARAAALGAVLVAGLCGALIGWAVADVQAEGSFWPVVGMLFGGVITGGGVAVVAVLALRASTEWRATVDPTESAPRARLGRDQR
jgi:hypothetical protein